MTVNLDRAALILTIDDLRAVLWGMAECPCPPLSPVRVKDWRRAFRASMGAA
jgi:hypothetical protein